MEQVDNLVLGAGYIGKRIAKDLGYKLTPERINSLDDAIDLLERWQPKVLINAIGFGGKVNVDDCEREIERTFHANSVVPLYLAEACYRTNTRLVHLSSGCIFKDTEEPIKEDKEPDYHGLYYSRTKINAELVLKHYNALILRIRVPMDDIPHPKNIITKVLSFKRVIDRPNSVTYIPEFIKALDFLIKKGCTGIYNIALNGSVFYESIINEWSSTTGEDKDIQLVYDLDIERTNTILSVMKLKKEGFNPSFSYKAIQKCVRNYAKNTSREP